MLRRRVAPAGLALALLLAACGGSDAPAPATGLEVSAESTDVSEADAIRLATEAAAAQDLSVEGLEVKPSKIFGEWQVSFEPPGASLSGGFLVILKAGSGEFVDLVPYQ